MPERISFDEIMSIQGASRKLCAYAFLDATLESTEATKDPIRDALECFIPFIARGVTEQKGHQLDYEELQKYLKAQFGFDVPIYSLEQISSRLESGGYLEYSETLRSYVCREKQDNFSADREAFSFGYDSIESGLISYAKSLGLDAPPESPTWLDAIISFLRIRQEEKPAKTLNVKGVLTSQSAPIEEYVVGKFVEHAYTNNRDLFDAICRVFKGVLIEEFISTVTELSIQERLRDLVLFYDTAVLMRLLGCSGGLLEVATKELHRDLQDIGAATQMLHVTESEVANIISTIIGKSDQGAALYGETAEAIERGEITIAHLRRLDGRFVEELAKGGVFETRHRREAIQKPERFQIGETQFANYLREQALKRGINYGTENIENDARVVGEIMLFRRGAQERDFTKCKFAMITGNKFLCAASRKFMTSEGNLRWIDCPPILHVGQVATIAWLLRRRSFDKESVGAELLANCYAAFKTDPDWFERFVEAMERGASGSEEMLEDSVLLQAARRIARDESFGRSAILERLNVADILSRANKEKLALAKNEKAAGHREGREEAVKDIRARNRKRAEKASHAIVRLIQWLFASLAVAALALTAFGGESYILWTILATLFGILSALDLLGFAIVKPLFERIREPITRAIQKFFDGTG